MRKPRIDPFSVILILACVAWTSQTLFFDKTLEQAGAITRHRLWEGDIWRIWATLLLHGNGWHLALNCLAIFFVGPVVAIGVGPRTYLATVGFSALAGLAASLLIHDPNIPLVGISGGILGLIGLILAIEWRNARGKWMAFFRQRNVVVITILILVNAIIAVIFEMKSTTVKLDHAAHLGGLGFGLLGGLALFGKDKMHIGRGVAAAVILAVVPVAVAAWPNWSPKDIQYLAPRAKRARLTGDRGKAVRLYEFMQEIDPGDPISGSWLAYYSDDPTRLDGLREATGDHEKRPAIAVRLELARRRLADDPATAARLAQEASGIRLKYAGPWLRFAEAADKAKRRQLASLAYQVAARDLDLSEKWRGSANALKQQVGSVREAGLKPSERLERALKAVELAQTAVGALTDKVPAAHRAAYRGELIKGLLELDKLAALLKQKVLFGELAKAWHNFGNNTTEVGAGRPVAFLRAAVSLWQAEGVTDAVKQAFKTAAEEAREEKDGTVERQALAWFQARGLPAPDLADPERGG